MGTWDFLTPAMLRAGPRRLTVEPEIKWYTHAEPPPHVPPLPYDYRERVPQRGAENPRRRMPG